MSLYERVFRAFGLSDVLWRIATGAIAHPNPGLYTPYPAAGFPPALVPVWVDPGGLQYTGYWLPLFTDRRPTLVVCAAEDLFEVHEVARTPEQLLTSVLLTAVGSFGGVTEEHRAFAAAAGLDLAAVEATANQVGDDPAELVRFAPFASDPPLSFCLWDMASYHGDFPHPSMPVTAESMRRFGTFEISEDFRLTLAARPDAPPWFGSHDLPATFDALLAAGDYAGAWMTLCSRGWLAERAERAVADLVAASGDPGLSVLAQAWLAEPRDGVPMY